jgi:hypothetical protein
MHEVLTSDPDDIDPLLQVLDREVRASGRGRR